jgi:hypothetical protein
MKTLFLAITVILCSPLLSLSQEPQGRAATVNVIKGEPIKGQFVKADDKTVTLEQGAATISIKLEEITSIVFDAAAAEAPKEDKGLNAARSAIKSLRRLASATEVGISYVNYSPLLAEVKTEVDSLLPDIPSGDLRGDIATALKEYTVAGTVWNQTYTVREVPSKSELGRWLIDNYGIPIKISVWTSVPRDTALGYIWQRARAYFNAAVVLAK